VAEGRVSFRTLARHGKPTIFNTDQGSQGGLNRSSQHVYVED
jgi:hypothetical protein